MSVNGADLTEQDYLDVAEAAVAAACQAGAEEAEAAVGAGNDFSATVRQGKTEKLLESGSKGVSLRVFVGGRAASVSTSDFAPAAIRRAASDAVDLAKISDPDECGGLPEAGFGLSAAPDDLETYDPATATLTPERLIDWAGRAEQAAFDAHARITNSDGGTAGRTTMRVTLANSHGFAASYRRSSCGIGIEAIADDDGGKKRNGWWWSSHRSASQLESPEAVGRTAAERTVRQLGARQAPTGPVPVVWDVTVGPALLGIYARAADGHAAYRRSTFLLGREGETIGSASAVIVDDPTRPGLPASRPFDGEGLPTQRNVLFDAGRFTDFLLDTYSARKLGKTSTHSAGRGGEVQVDRIGGRVAGATARLHAVAQRLAGEAASDGHGHPDVRRPGKLRRPRRQAAVPDVDGPQVVGVLRRDQRRGHRDDRHRQQRGQRQHRDPALRVLDRDPAQRRLRVVGGRRRRGSQEVARHRQYPSLRPVRIRGSITEYRMSTIRLMVMNSITITIR